jgi:hypothetical protein
MIRLLTLLCWLGLAVAVSGQEASGGRVAGREVRDAVRAVVEDQLTALQKEDFAAAYRHAALGLRQQFRAEVFEAMIRRGYPALLAHRRSDLGIVRETREGRAFVDVTVFDARDRATRFRYHLVREGGEWRVEGVIGLRAAPRGDT